MSEKNSITLPPSNLSQAPIGVFDSGFGGLTVLKDLQRELPQEQFIYFGDDANCPYGPRLEEEVRQLAIAASAWLIAEHQVKLIVVACNTASVTARNALRETFPDIPFVVVVPAVKVAATLTQTKVVTLAATARAIQDRFTNQLISDFGAGVTFHSVACPDLVTLVEAGKFSGLETETALETYLRPSLNAGSDVIVLGCTHFPAIRSAIEKIAGPHTQIIDSGAAVARQTRAVLSQRSLLNDGPSLPKEHNVDYWTSGDPVRFAHIASQIMDYSVTARHAETQFSQSESTEIQAL